MTAKKKATLEMTLNGIVYLVDHWDGKSPHTFIKDIRKHTVDALELLKTPDPMVRHIGFIVLALQTGTHVSERMLNGKLITRVTITDHTLYNWALAEIHKLPEKLA
jgi:hypothetical protein